MSTILNQMNDEQKRAIVATEGPIIVLAGAGSGKTRVLVHKVLYLIQEKHVSPHAIVMLTFTNKAAGEMKERILTQLQKLGIFTSAPTVGTFHSLCAKILRIDGEAINIARNFTIYDTTDQIQTVKDAMALLSLSAKDAKPRSLLSAISQNKNQLIDPVSYTSIARGRFQEVVAKVYPIYQQLMRDRQALDFDDLLLETIRLFKTQPDILRRYQEQFKYVLIDEYQDTNHAQYELSKMISGMHKNICIVGDFSQSIYSFRGADFRNLKKFQQDFPDAQVFPLSQNYRSTQNILDAAYSVISNNTSHPVLNLWTDNPAGDDLTIIQTENEHQEIEKIISIIHRAMDKNPNLRYSDVAILYRMNAQSRTIEEVLLHHSIPYILVGGLRFYERKEIKDVLSYLSYLSTQKDAVALKRIEKLGKKRLSYFLEYLVEFETNGYHETKSTIEILDEVIRQTQYLGMYDEKDPEDAARLENIRELRSVALEFPKLTDFLENVALVEQEYRSDKSMQGAKPNAVTLMTLHAAKGLEFSMVFMIGMEEGLFPHSQALFDTSELEEERRLCYVGITRAKTTLTLSFAKRRLFFGQRITPTVSRFVMELPNKVVEKNLKNIPHADPDFFNDVY